MPSDQSLPRHPGSVLVEGTHYRVSDTGCWLWMLSTDRRGYGLTTGALREIDARAHRAALKLAGHVVPKGVHVHHDCKTTGCVNPAHLTVKTPAEHFLAHKLEEKTGLTIEDVKAIRELSADPTVTAAEVARRYGVHEITVYEWWSGAHWPEHLDGPAPRPVRECLWCGKEFSAKRRHAKYCCPQHRTNYNTRRRIQEARSLAA